MTSSGFVCERLRGLLLMLFDDLLDTRLGLGG
jgi:hypothetical protein